MREERRQAGTPEKQSIPKLPSAAAINSSGQTMSAGSAAPLTLCTRHSAATLRVANQLRHLFKNAGTLE